MQVYSQLEGQKSQVVNTAWAVLALISAGYHHRDTKQIQKGVCCLLQQQLPSGDWPQEHITGVFNRNCMITYANYRYVASHVEDLLLWTLLILGCIILDQNIDEALSACAWPCGASLRFSL